MNRRKRGEAPFVVQATVEKRVGHRPHGVSDASSALDGCGNGVSHGSECHDVRNQTIHDADRANGEWGRRLAVNEIYK